MVHERPFLLVEDNDDDAELTALAFAQANIRNPLVRIGDGQEALDYLFRAGAHAARRLEDEPVVVLLDLKLPRLDGLAVLRALRTDSRTSHLPVVVLTSSDEEADRLAAYEHHANSYVRKPVDHDRFVEVTRQLGVYWVAVNEPPPRPT